MFETLGLDTAARNLREYRSGRGRDVEYSDEEIARHPRLLEAEDANRTHFESKTFAGKTGRKEINEGLIGLRDGGTFTFNDYWDDDIRLSRPSTYFAFG